jgi:hypothetical protein
LKVDESLNLEGLPIGAIPPGLQVDGDCRLSDLRACGNFGAGTRIGGDISLSNLPELKAIPKDLFVGGKVIVDSSFDPLLVPGHLRDKLVLEMACSVFPRW